MACSSLISLDIFDTIITRNTITPKGIFSLIQEKLQKQIVYQSLPEILKNNFFTIRVNAEIFAREQTAEQEITFNEIYKHIASSYGLNKEETKLLQELELETEKENFVAIPHNINYIKDLVSQGSNICLISDMYLSSSDIKSILVKIDPVFADIPIFTSSDLLKTKSSGEIYPIIQQIYKINYQNWYHIGDNNHSDIIMAKKYGIQTQHYLYPRLEEYEIKVLKDLEQDIYTQITLGATKYAKILSKTKGKYELGVGIAGTLLFMYVYWILEQSIKLRINRLYFIARDGYILKKIADIIIKNQRLQINTHYIYGSRIVWHRLFIDSNTDFTKLGNIINTASCYNIYNFLLLFGLEDCEQFIQSLPQEYQQLNKILKQEDINFLTVYLNTNNSSRRLLLNQLKFSQDLLKQYLKQEINYQDNYFAFVDLRGSGFTPRCLAKIFNTFYNNKLNFFYLETIDNTNREVVNFYEMLKHSNKSPHNILETFVRAPHGQTIGYKLNNENLVVPVLEHTEEQAIINDNFEQYLQGIKDFTFQYLIVLKRHNIYPVNLNLFYLYQNFLLFSPDRKTADLIGSTPFVSYGSSNKVEEYAPIFSNNKQFQTNWLVGSMERNRFLQQNNCKMYVKSKKIFHIYISKTKKIFYIKVLGFVINLSNLVYSNK